MSKTFELNSLFRKQPFNGNAFDLQSDSNKSVSYNPPFFRKEQTILEELFTI